MEEIKGPELYFGLVAPVGTDLNLVEISLRRNLEGTNYKFEKIKLIDLVKEIEDWSSNQASISDIYNARMNAGNNFRLRFQKNDAIARLAIGAIQNGRKNHWESEEGALSKPVPRRVCVIHSLKTPQEVEFLRDIYGANFFVIAAYAPIDQRRKSLAEQLAAFRKDPEVDRYRSIADDLIRRDEYERVEYGQNVRETFPLADVFVDARDKNTTDHNTRRFVEIVFGHPERTPKRDEIAMFHAFGAKLRSSSGGRQVGAAITTEEGTVIALGTNEVAKAGGGQYWEGDEYDQRDFNHYCNSSKNMREAILHDLLARLRTKGWLNSERTNLELSTLLGQAEKELMPPIANTEQQENDPMTLGEKAILGRLIEFMRPVHAEMAAITDCSRRGVSAQNCTLYVTTFPCHECARLIVASGIRRIVFIEPYPKSRTSSMYDDSINIDMKGDKNHVACEAFVGIAPRRFIELFEYQDPRGENPPAEVKRVQKDGSWVDWNDIKTTREPRRVELPISIITREIDILGRFKEELARLDTNPKVFAPEESKSQQTSADGDRNA